MKRARGFTLIELMIVLAIIGVMASVALPSFLKYIRRSRTVEATMALRRMYDGAVTYYLTDHANAAGLAQPKRFPGSVGPTPATIPAGISVLPPPPGFGAPEWQSLDFGISDPQRYAYEFQDNGLIGTSASAKMIAWGDLDGDTVPSYFARQCDGTANGVAGGNRLMVLNELE